MILIFFLAFFGLILGLHSVLIRRGAIDVVEIDDLTDEADEADELDGVDRGRWGWMRWGRVGICMLVT